MKSRRRSLLALALLAPVPTLGIASALIWFPGPVGRAIFSAAKIWLIVFPAAWYLFVEKGRLSWSPPKNGGFKTGALVGLVMAGAIAAACCIVVLSGFDPKALRGEVAEMGLATMTAYVFGALYWIFFNSVVEEYVFRWFVQGQCESLMAHRAAILVSAAVFTTHHVVAMATYLSPGLTAVASAGVFIAGATWSWMMARYRSIWPGWVAHAIADVAVFASGGYLLFG